MSDGTNYANGVHSLLHGFPLAQVVAEASPRPGGVPVGVKMAEGIQWARQCPKRLPMPPVSPTPRARFGWVRPGPCKKGTHLAPATSATAKLHRAMYRYTLTFLPPDGLARKTH